MNISCNTPTGAARLPAGCLPLHLQLSGLLQERGGAAGGGEEGAAEAAGGGPATDGIPLQYYTLWRLKPYRRQQTMELNKLHTLRFHTSCTLRAPAADFALILAHLC